MNKKIKKYLDEIAKTEKKIADLQQYLRGVQAALKASEASVLSIRLRMQILQICYITSTIIS